MVATKALDDKEQQLNSPELKSKNRLRLLFIRATFVIAWLSFSALIFLIAILANINWTRPSLEQMIGQSIHRNVKLGRLSWNIGLHGLSVNTTRLLISERQGSPFLMAGNCEIGFSIWPLLLGIGRIQYVDMQKPLFMAVHTGAKTWNFDDMLVVSPDIDFIEIHGGHIFVVDKQPGNNRFPDAELNDVHIKLQRAANFAPAQINIAFNLPKQKDIASYSLAGKIWGDESKKWWDRKCHFELATKRFTTQNWQTVTSLAAADSNNPAYANFVSRLNTFLPSFLSNATGSAQVFIPTSGQFDLHAVADGIPSKNILADLQLKADNLVIYARNKSTINLPETSLATQLELKPDSIAWNKCTIQMPGYALFFNSSGQSTIDSKANQPDYNWSMVGLLGDLKKLGPLLVFIYNNISSATTSSASKCFSNLDGKLFLDLQVKNSQGKGDYSVEARANDVNINSITPLLLSINTLAKNDSGLINPLEGPYSKDLNLSKQAEFYGTIMAKSGQGLTLKDCYLEDNEIKWKVSGETDPTGSWTKLEVSNDNLLLDRVSEKINKEPQFAKQTKTFLGLKQTSNIQLSGKAQIIGRIIKPENSAKQDSNNFICETNFEDASLKLSDPHLNITHLTGNYLIEPNKLSCKGLTFEINGSNVSIDATMSTNKNEPLSFHLHASNININDLSEILTLFHLDTNYIDNWHLSGKLVEIDLFLKGTIEAPVLSVNTWPVELVFTVPNLKQPLKAHGGKIVYDANNLLIEKINFSHTNSKAIISLSARNTSTANKLERLSLLLSNADLSDLPAICSLFKTSSNPYIPFTKKYQIANAKGTVSGAVEYRDEHNKQKISGTLDFDNVSFKSGQAKLSFRNVKGKAVITDNDLILQETNGNAENTSFTLNGRIINYKEISSKDKPPQWQGDVSAQIAPEQMDNISALFVPPDQKIPVSLHAKKPIYIKLRTNGHTQSLVLICDPDTSLIVNAANLTLYQPPKRTIISGLCTIDGERLTWRNLSCDFSGASINIQGSVNNFHASKDSKSDPIYDLQIQTSDYFPANYLAEIIQNGTATGQLKSTLSIKGTARSPIISGKVTLMDVGIPNLYLGHLVGNISFQPTADAANSVPALVQLDRFNLGPVSMLQGSGTLTWQNSDNIAKQSTADLSQMTLKNFVANLAQGQFTSDGQADLKAQKLHLNMAVKDANLNQLWPQLTNSQIKANGSFNSNVTLDTTGSTAKELEQNMISSGSIHISSGSFSRLSQLHAKLNQVNLLHQGIFGFNVNNVMQSVLPAKASEFNTIDSAFSLDKEILTIKHVLYDGKDIKFSAAGKVDLSSHDLNMDIAGVMPRVSNSVLGGKLGELSREITLQKLLDGITMHKLEKLPSLPLIGGMAGGPALFTCTIMAPYDQPKAISQSIEKSFHWLHSH